MATTIFRFYNTETTTHFYTANPDEVDVILETLPHYRFEGPKFNVEAGNTNVFRLFNLETGAHTERGSPISERMYTLVISGQFRNLL